MKDYIDRFIETVKNNTNGFAEVVRLGIMMLMGFEVIHWTEAQMFMVLGFISAILATFVGKTTVPAAQIDRKVDAKVAHRELTGMSGTGDGLVAPTAPREIPPTPKEDSEVKTAPKIPLIVLVALLGSLAACGPKLPPDLSTEGKMAVRGTQLIAGLRATLPSLKQATCQPGVPEPCLATTDTDKVVAHIQTASKVAQELAVALTAVDDAKTAAERTTGMDKARALLNSIQGSLTQATVSPGAEGARQKVVQILGTVTSLLFAVSAF